jgi:hypothetical protein
MPQLTPEYERVTIYGFLTSDTTHFNIIEYIKMIQMIQEIRMSEEYCSSDITIFDLANYTLAHVPKISLADVKKYELCALVSISIIMHVQTLHVAKTKLCIAAAYICFSYSKV